MPARRWITIDGNEAAASVAYRLSEVIAIYPITPASPMGELSDEWAANKMGNAWGGIPQVTEMQSEGGAAAAVPELAAELGFPVVVKPRRLSASRGVIRADDAAAAAAAAARVASIAAEADEDAGDGLIIEEYVPGAEIAIEGLLADGELTVLAVIDKR